MNIFTIRKMVNQFFRKHKVRGRTGKLLTCPPLSTVRGWMAEGLASGPSGTPRNPVYPPDTWIEVAVAIYLMHYKGLSREYVRVGRQHVLVCIREQKSVTEKLSGLQKNNPADFSSCFLWIATALKIQQGYSPEHVAQITEKWTPAGWVWLVGIAPKGAEQNAPMVDRIERVEENERPTA